MSEVEWRLLEFGFQRYETMLQEENASTQIDKYACSNICIAYTCYNVAYILYMQYIYCILNKYSKK